MLIAVADLSPQIKQYAADHEMEIKDAVIRMLCEYYDSSLSTNYEEKWDKGEREHGLFTEEKLNGVDWSAQFFDEAKDAFWYMTIMKYRKENEA